MLNVFTVCMASCGLTGFWITVAICTWTFFVFHVLCKTNTPQNLFCKMNFTLIFLTFSFLIENGNWIKMKHPSMRVHIKQNPGFNRCMMQSTLHLCCVVQMFYCCPLRKELISFPLALLTWLFDPFRFYPVPYNIQGLNSGFSWHLTI